MQSSKNTCIEGSMEQRFSLEAAGKLLGISANAMRARAKKSPEKYRMERDNGGKIWLWIDPENLPAAKARKVSHEGSKIDELKASIEAVSDLRERLTGAEIRAVRAETERDAAIARADAAEADRDRWQAMAEKLADRPGWWARLWGRN